ncbi:hypothetical protein OEIGOIKO_05020 [Streptomyces chrestomyceticus JCM 4735]|uniref:Uncharacterized protein n=2 Tax=Streptomyces chrestomyceticus TaxID=68185 RepID=A0A7U9PZW5_9ACTN|nr:hypothetical protein OEIGOIKO_05020 [Streptomyces chrestomyceticus JCM 4735]
MIFYPTTRITLELSARVADDVPMPTEPKKRSRTTPPDWRMDPIPSRRAYRDEDGNIRVPMWLTKNGRHTADTEMVLLPSEADLLVDNVTRAMRDDPRSMLRGRFPDSATALAPGVLYVPKGTP